MGFGDIGALAIVCVFSIPVVAIVTEHRRKVLELKLKLRDGAGDSSVRAAVEALRDEVRSLRDTTTQYDISFDTALHRMEQRVETLERRSALPQQDVVQETRVGRPGG